jgi:hypothetical protein
VSGEGGGKGGWREEGRIWERKGKTKHQHGLRGKMKKRKPLMSRIILSVFRTVYDPN